ncbi:MAG: LysM peptidoglycan-binding domain-containing protein, partial [Chloroflexi bacterium]|nr:LysM peptidoglycan-binding domain-containing protein [Chloroflexota bacterium]
MMIQNCSVDETIFASIRGGLQQTSTWPPVRVKEHFSIHYNLLMRTRRFLLLLFLAACVNPAEETLPQATLSAYTTLTPAGTMTPYIKLADTPIPTATSFTHVIRQGDTLSELAETFNVSQDDLLAANPNLDPNALAIGETIQIPGSSSAAAGADTPTPAPIPITQTICHRTADSGMWCFALLHNDTGQSVENPAVLFN